MGDTGPPLLGPDLCAFSCAARRGLCPVHASAFHSVHQAALTHHLHRDTECHMRRSPAPGIPRHRALSLSLSLSRFLLGLNTQTVAPPPGLLLNMTWALVVSQPLLSPLYTCGGHRCPWAPCIDMPSGSRAEPPRWRGPGPGLQGAFSGFDCPLASCLLGSPLEHPAGS